MYCHFHLLYPIPQPSVVQEYKFKSYSTLYHTRCVPYMLQTTHKSFNCTCVRRYIILPNVTMVLVSSLASCVGRHNFKCLPKDIFSFLGYLPGRAGVVPKQ